MTVHQTAQRRPGTGYLSRPAPSGLADVIEIILDQGTVIAAYSPRVRAGVPVSFPVQWDDLDAISPRDFTVHTALDHLGDRDPWAEQMPDPQTVPEVLVQEGGDIPVGRVAAMHKGKRRKRAAERGDP